MPYHDDALTYHTISDTMITIALIPDSTLGQGTFGTWHVLPSTSMVDSVTCLRYAECSRAPDYVINGYGYPTIPYHTIPDADY